MPTSQLIRWSGLSLMLGGTGLAVESVTHPAGETAQYVLEPVWGFSHWLGAVAWLLILLGLFGLYARQAERVGRLGLVGFVMAAAGSALAAGTFMVGGAVLQPIMAQGAPHLLDSDGPFFTDASVKVAGGLILAGFIGFVLLAIATLRARTLPLIGSWIVILLVPAGIVAGPLVLVVAPGREGIVLLLLGIAIAAACMAWGYALWRHPRDSALSAPTVGDREA
jgi:hypothetical protein